MKKHQQLGLDFSRAGNRHNPRDVPTTSATASVSVSSRSSISSTATSIATAGGGVRAFMSKTLRLPQRSPKFKSNRQHGHHGPSLEKPISGSAGGGSGDKAVCQYCGVSYLTIAEMRLLQTQVKEQNERLSHYQDVIAENNHLKEGIATMRQKHHDEFARFEDEVQWLKGRCHALESQLEHPTATPPKSSVPDPIHVLLDDKMKVFESAIRKIILHPQFKDKPETDSLICRLDEINRLAQESQLKFKQSQHQLASLGTGDSTRATDKKIKSEAFEDRRKGKSKRSAGGESAGKVPVPSSLTGIEVHDLRRENLNLVEKIRNLSADYANCQEMHSNLRETLDKLKRDNDSLHEEMNALRVQHENSLLANENLEAQIKGFRTENERLRSVGKELEFRLRASDEQNRILKNSVDHKLVDRLQFTLGGLKKQIQEHQLQTERVRLDYETKLSEAERETVMEKERADSCLAASLHERQEVEKRWEERWNRHQASLTEQLETLREHYEKTLASVKGHEESLQKEVNNMREKYDKSKDAWEAYRKSLSEQVTNWKQKYEQKQNDLETASQSKVEVELLYQEKSREMESLHEIIREGCEERQDLQRQITEMKEILEEARLQRQSLFPSGRRSSDSSGPGSSSFRASMLGDNSFLLNDNGGYYSYNDLKTKNKMRTFGIGDDGMEPIPTGFMAPPSTNKIILTADSYYIPPPPPTAPQLSIPAIGFRKTPNKVSVTCVGDIDPHLFTIGKGQKQSGSLTSSPSSKSPNNGGIITSSPSAGGTFTAKGRSGIGGNPKLRK